jgi:hypothetical protein
MTIYQWCLGNLVTGGNPNLVSRIGVHTSQVTAVATSINQFLRLGKWHKETPADHRRADAQRALCMSTTTGQPLGKQTCYAVNE